MKYTTMIQIKEVLADDHRVTIGGFPCRVEVGDRFRVVKNPSEKADEIDGRTATNLLNAGNAFDISDEDLLSACPVTGRGGCFHAVV